MPCCVRQYPGQDKNLSDLSLITRGGDVVFCSEMLVSSKRHISELMVPGFGRPIQLVRLIDFEGWLYTCVKAFRHIDSEVMSAVVVKS